jgi:membrane fusion protein (multidrug efflux system)
MRQIRIGVRKSGWVEVESGLEAGEAVITEGIIKIRAGSPVTTERVASGPGPGGRPPGPGGT